MALAVIGFCSLDTYSNGDQYIGGGAFATSLHAALWGAHVTLYTYLGPELPLSVLEERVAPLGGRLRINALPADRTTSVRIGGRGRVFVVESLGGWAGASATEFEFEPHAHWHVKLPAARTRALLPLLQGGALSVNLTGRVIMADLCGVDLAFLNEREAVAATGAPRDQALSLLREHSDVALTLGERGAVLASRLAAWYLPALAVRDPDALGCGDAFAGGVLAQRSAGLDLMEQLTAGVASAALTAQMPGALPDPTFAPRVLDQRRDALEAHVREVLNGVEEVIREPIRHVDIDSPRLNSTYWRLPR